MAIDDTDFASPQSWASWKTTWVIKQFCHPNPKRRHMSQRVPSITQSHAIVLFTRAQITTTGMYTQDEYPTAPVSIPPIVKGKGTVMVMVVMLEVVLRLMDEDEDDIVKYMESSPPDKHVAMLEYEGHSLTLKRKKFDNSDLSSNDTDYTQHLSIKLHKGIDKGKNISDKPTNPLRIPSLPLTMQFTVPGAQSSVGAAATPTRVERQTLVPPAMPPRPPCMALKPHTLGVRNELSKQFYNRAVEKFATLYNASPVAPLWMSFKDISTQMPKFKPLFDAKPSLFTQGALGLWFQGVFCVFEEKLELHPASDTSIAKFVEVLKMLVGIDTESAVSVREKLQRYILVEEDLDDVQCVNESILPPSDNDIFSLNDL
ncbi:hypothetical protein K439DRAFT_1527757 [Ramaria rubella]|nr:hypothetical protein K439DRAFT_1527757 [Ramaria rubella]